MKIGETQVGVVGILIENQIQKEMAMRESEERGEEVKGTTMTMRARRQGDRKTTFAIRESEEARVGSETTENLWSERGDINPNRKSTESGRRPQPQREPNRRQLENS